MYGITLLRWLLSLTATSLASLCGGQSPGTGADQRGGRGGRHPGAADAHPAARLGAGLLLHLEVNQVFWQGELEEMQDA